MNTAIETKEPTILKARIEALRKSGFSDTEIINSILRLSDTETNAPAAKTGPKKYNETDVTNLLSDLGLPSHIKGFAYVRTAIMLVQDDHELINHVLKVLYPKSAKIHETTNTWVERDIRHAIKLGYSRGNAETYNKIFGFSISPSNSIPTNSQFIATIVDSIAHGII